MRRLVTGMRGTGQVFDHVLGLALRRVYRVVSPAGATRKLLSF
jgi:hypothetical protein